MSLKISITAFVQNNIILFDKALLIILHMAHCRLLSSNMN